MRRNAASADSADIAPARGLDGDGSFSMRTLSRPNSPSTASSRVLLIFVGSAQMRIRLPRFFAPFAPSRLCVRFLDPPP